MTPGAYGMDEETAFAAGRSRERLRGAGQLFDLLRTEIMSLKLAPGTVLSRLELQERFGLSSTPIRDALMRLQEEGLVDIFPQHATLVSRIDLRRAREAQFLRRSVEIEIVRLLAAAPDEQLVGQLRSIIRQQEAFAGLDEQEAFTARDELFHRVLYEAADVADLWQVVRRQGGHIDRLRRLNLPVAGKMQEIVRDHAAVVDAVAKGEPRAAEEAMRAHLSRSLGFADRLRDAHPDYFSD